MHKKWNIWLKFSFFLFTLCYSLSFLLLSVLAASATGSTYSFYCGENKFSLYASLSIENNQGVASTRLYSTDVRSPAGYLGAAANIYRESSPGAGTYYLVAAGQWFYNDSTSGGIYVSTDLVPIHVSGNYMAQGDTAVYYNGSYQYRYTYITPFITID